MGRSFDVPTIVSSCARWFRDHPARDSGPPWAGEIRLVRRDLSERSGEPNQPAVRHHKDLAYARESVYIEHVRGIETRVAHDGAEGCGRRRERHTAGRYGTPARPQRL